MDLNPGLTLTYAPFHSQKNKSIRAKYWWTVSFLPRRLFSVLVWRGTLGLEFWFLPSLGHPAQLLWTPLCHAWKESVSCPFMIHWGPQHLGSIGACGKAQNFTDGRSLSLYVHGSAIDYLCDFGEVAQLHSESVYSCEKWGKQWRIINCGWETCRNVLSHRVKISTQISLMPITCSFHCGTDPQEYHTELCIHERQLLMVRTKNNNKLQKVPALEKCSAIMSHDYSCSL